MVNRRVPWTDQEYNENAPEIERLIRRAGRCVMPSDDLRPRILEAAQDINEVQHTRRQVAVWSATALAGSLLFAVLLRRADQWHNQVASPSSQMIQAEAANISARKKTSLDWGLFEAFSKLRQTQADKLRPSK